MPNNNPLDYTHKIRYSVGFPIDYSGRVLLIKKDHPDWQNGKLNGVGGKVDDGESFLSAMVREFQEETSVITEEDNWKLKVRLYAPGVVVFFFVMHVDNILEIGAKSVTSETIELYYWKILPDNVIFNLRYIIPICLDESLHVVDIHDRHSTDNK